MVLALSMAREYTLRLVGPPNRNRHDDRIADELLGLCRGIVADGAVNSAEADFLREWMTQRAGQCLSYPFPQLLTRIHQIYEDGVVDEGEQQELASMLRALTGVTTKQEVAGDDAKQKATRLFFDDPAPSVDFADRLFCVTGTFASGSRSKIEERLKELGASLIKAPTIDTHFLLVGTFCSDAWKHGNYGRKIETAIDYRTKGHGIRIIAEEHWLTFLPTL